MFLLLCCSLFHSSTPPAVSSPCTSQIGESMGQELQYPLCIAQTPNAVCSVHCTSTLNNCSNYRHEGKEVHELFNCPCPPHFSSPIKIKSMRVRVHTHIHIYSTYNGYCRTFGNSWGLGDGAGDWKPTLTT